MATVTSTAISEQLAACFPLTVTGTLDELFAALNHNITEGLTRWVVERDSGNTVDLTEHVTGVAVTVEEPGRQPLSVVIYGTDPGGDPVDVNTNASLAAHHTYRSGPWKLAVEDDSFGGPDCPYLQIWSSEISGNGDRIERGSIDNELQWFASGPADNPTPLDVVAHTALTLICHETLESCWTGRIVDSPWGTRIPEHLIGPHTDDQNTGLHNDATVTFHAAIGGTVTVVHAIFD